MKRMRRRKTGIILIGILLVLVLFILWQMDILQAVFDEKDAVHIKSETIEDSTLMIGTHLIHLSALDDTLYKIASDSASASGQTEIYYKSELGDGKWYSISNAKSLTDITEKGKRISDHVIEEQWLTHHTKSDGKTYDLRTGEEVSKYDIISPYDLHKLPELEALELLDRAGKNTGSLFKTKVEDEESKTLDGQLAALEDLKETLFLAGMSKDQAEMLERTMERLDALRRNRVYEKIIDALHNLADNVGAKDAAVDAALGECLRQVEDAILETQDEMLDVGETVMTALETELQKKLIENSEQKPEEYFEILRSLAALNNIVNGISKDPEEEKRILEEELIPRAKVHGEEALNELQFYEEALLALEKTEEASQSELEKLYEEKKDLKQKRLEALDNNDLKEAKQLEAFLEEKNQEIKEKEAAASGGEQEVSGDLSIEDAAEVLETEAEGSPQTELIALSMYCEQTGAKEMKELLKGKAEMSSIETEAYTFPKVSGNAGVSYVSAETLASYISYRYIFSSNKKEATLASKGDFYRFQAFDNIVERKGGEQITLEHPCRFRSTVYIPGDYAEEEFGVRICELYGTGYCVLADGNLQEKAAKVCEALIEKGGE